MDEVDEIVLSSLRELGFDAKRTIPNLKVCPFEDMVRMAIHCLNVIRPDLRLTPTLPPHMSAKFHACAHLANQCKELGYKGDVGYHTFLYSNTTDIRNVIIFLVEHLPRKTTFEESEKAESASETIRQRTIEELKRALHSNVKDAHPGMCSAPFASIQLETGILLPNQKIDCKPLEWKDFVIKKLPFIDEQVAHYQQFLPSLISLNSSGIVNPIKSKYSKFSANSTAAKQAENKLPSDDELADVTSENIAQSSHESELETDNAEYLELEKQIQNSKAEVEVLVSKLQELNQSNENLKKTLSEKYTQESVLEKSLLLLPDSGNNIPKLLAANEKCKNKIASMDAQWKNHKELLLEKRSELRQVLGVKTNAKNDLTHQILEIRKELYDANEQIQKLQHIENKLIKKSEAMKGVQRKEYIQRILEIIKNIKKQDYQIARVLADLRVTQKEINTLSGKINRSFTLAEQLVINSTNDEFSHETHKLLLLLHKDVSDIITVNSESGNLSREIKDLEQQVQENTNDVSNCLQQVLADNKRIKDEQSILIEQIEKITGKKEAQMGTNRSSKK